MGCKCYFQYGCFLLGGVIGAGVALLFAPRPGVETRALIAEKADEYWGKGQTWYDQGKSYVRESVADVQPSINKKSDELRQKIESARTLIAEQVAKNAAAARDTINEKMPVAAEKINQAADVVRGRIDQASDAVKSKFTHAGEEASAELESVVAEVEAAVEPQAAVPVEAPDKIEPAE